MALYEDVIKYLNEKNKGGGTSGGMFDNYDESNNPFIMDFDKDEETDAIPFNNPIVEAAIRDNESNNPYNMNAMNNPNVRTKRDYFDPKSFMTEKTQKQGFSVSGLLKGLLSSAIPGMGMINMAKGVAGLLPANKRALMENDLLSKGYSLNSAGQIVTDNYNSKTGVMAGLNANQINEATFDKKSARLEKTLADKYGLSPSDIAAAKAGTYSGNTKAQNIIDRLGFTAQARADFLGSTKTAEELEEEINDFKKNQNFFQKLGIATPSFTNKFQNIGVKAAQNTRDMAIKAAEEKAQREEMDRMRREIESKYANQKGEHGGEDRQQEREEAGPGYNDVGDAGSF